MWNKDCKGESGCTETKQEAETVAQGSKTPVVRGNGGEKQLGSREL